MEYKKIEKLLRENKNVLIFAVAAGILTGLFFWGTNANFSVSLTLTNVRVAQGQSLDYNYDSYYALKASDEFSSVISGWLKTPETVGNIFKKAGLDYLPSSFSDFSGQFKAIKVSSGVLEVRFGASSKAEAEKIGRAVGEIIAQKNQTLAEISKQSLNFLTLAGEPVILKNSFWNILEKALMGFFAGLIFGLFFESARKYFV